ncbi:MAPEG family protein [Boseongicola aestuarii]|uniref:MAPEG family protein n=1 Tax=Boseongicola aestuarii TaxID=1470561 RepID=A0A238IYV9_9RHOB|nr:MAPEG family protein [Boseongicola aestuarii]SMX23211.1 MAPEG family protein [Boseongicola aestuarii]
MSQLEFFTLLSALWIAVAWLPYILDRIMVRGLMGALANPSPDAIPQSAWAVRAMAAHKVAVEAFVAFGPVAVFAMMRMPEDSYPGILAMTFFIGIFAHYWIYVLGIVVLRTLSFALASLSTVALALRALGVI